MCARARAQADGPEGSKQIALKAHFAMQVGQGGQARDQYRSEFSTPSRSGNEDEDDEARSLREAERRAKR